MTKDTWSPQQYERFRKERSRPFWDLLALVQPRPGMKIVDLGCGTGDLTKELHLRLAARETLGIDCSPNMLERAREHTAPGLKFELGDIAQFSDGATCDLVFSNAAVQWVPDHGALFVRLSRALRAGGQLAVQVPANHAHPSHTVADEIADESPFAEMLGGWKRGRPVLEPEEYAVLLEDLGFAEQTVRLHVYGHHLESREAVVEWVKGTLLTDYEKRLPVEAFARYLESYRARLLPRLNDRRPYFFAFKRILVWARKPGRGGKPPG